MESGSPSNLLIAGDILCLISALEAKMDSLQPILVYYCRVWYFPDDVPMTQTVAPGSARRSTATHIDVVLPPPATVVTVAARVNQGAQDLGGASTTSGA